MGHRYAKNAKKKEVFKTLAQNEKTKVRIIVPGKADRPDRNPTPTRASLTKDWAHGNSAPSSKRTKG